MNIDFLLWLRLMSLQPYFCGILSGKPRPLPLPWSWRACESRLPSAPSLPRPGICISDKAQPMLLNLGPHFDSPGFNVTRCIQKGCCSYCHQIEIHTRYVAVCSHPASHLCPGCHLQRCEHDTHSPRRGQHRAWHTLGAEDVVAAVIA